MKLIMGILGVLMIVYVMITSFAIGVTGSQEQHLNLFGVSGLFWFFFYYLFLPAEEISYRAYLD